MKSAFKYLENLEFFGLKLGLNNISELLNEIGNPQNKLKTIHIAGTNGKGSVAFMLSECLNNSGFKTGLYSSPHIFSVSERFRINGKAVKDSCFSAKFAEIIDAVEKLKKKKIYPTYFEVTTAFAFKYFNDEKVDFAVIETGMGGRFDATNIISPLISVITGISLDHQKYLGSKLEKIAFEKAGIIKEKTPVICGRIPEKAEKIIIEKAKEKNSEIFLYENTPEPKNINFCFQKQKNKISTEFQYQKRNIKLSLPGTFQIQNSVLTIKILELLQNKFDINIDKAVNAFSYLNWPARFELMPDGTIVDGAHNPSAAEQLAKSLKLYFPEQKFTVIFASFEEKEPLAMLNQLNNIADKFIFTEMHARKRKTADPAELSAKFTKKTKIPCIYEKNLSNALNIYSETRKLVTGSLFFCAEAIQILKKHNK